MPQQKAAAFQIYLLPGNEEKAKEKLRELGNPANVFQPSLLNRDNFPTVHFSRFLIAPPITLKGKNIAASLIYSANLDVTVEEHWHNLATSIGGFLHELFQLCEGYSAEKDDPDTLISFMQAHFIKTPAFYVGAPDRTVDRIHMEDYLRRKVAELINENDQEEQSPIAAIHKIQTWLASEDNPYKSRLSEESSKTPRVWWIRAIYTGLVGLVTIILKLFILFPLIHFLDERRSKPLGLDVNQLNAKELEEKISKEDMVYQNQLSQVFITKGGPRKVLLHLNLFITKVLARNLEVKGKLLGTPTIHFARWIMIDGGKRFVFFSNYDGSYGEYLGDFIDNSGWGLNEIYGSSVGYPKTTFVWFGGAYNIGQFLGWGRYYQVETQAWYSAYPNLGLSQIINNSLIREGLYKKNLSEKQMEKLLRRI